MGGGVTPPPLAFFLRPVSCPHSTSSSTPLCPETDPPLTTGSIDLAAVYLHSRGCVLRPPSRFVSSTSLASISNLLLFLLSTLWIIFNKNSHQYCVAQLEFACLWYHLCAWRSDRGPSIFTWPVYSPSHPRLDEVTPPRCGQTDGWMDGQTCTQSVII